MTYSDKLRAEIAEALPGPRKEFLERHLATYERIGRQVIANGGEQREAWLALKWCRANGNPHLDKL